MTVSLKKIQSRGYADENLEIHFAETFEQRYKPHFADLAYQILSRPGTQEMLAKECKVSVRTIQRWKCPKYTTGEPNPFFKQDFAEKYLLGIIAQKAGYDEISLKNLTCPNKHFNPALYFGERKRLHNYSDERTTEIQELEEAKTYAESAQILQIKFAKGVLTASEFAKAANALHKIAEVIELEKLKLEVEQLKKASMPQGIAFIEEKPSEAGE